MKVSEILKVKGDILYTVTPESSLQQAIATMAEKDMYCQLIAKVI